MKKTIIILLLTIPFFGFGQMELKKTYHYNGKLKSELILKDGKKDGQSRFYYENGQLEEEGNYLDGKKVGLWKEYDQKGQLSRERMMDSGYNDITKGWVKCYYSNGQLRYIGKTNFCSDNYCVRSGVCLEFYKNGQLMSEGMYEHPSFTGGDGESCGGGVTVKVIFENCFDINNNKIECDSSMKYQDGYGSGKYWYDIYRKERGID